MIPDEFVPMLYGNDFFAALLFQSPRSPRWKFVKKLCERADATAEGDDFFIAAFRKEQNSLRLLATIADMVYEWKTARLFVQKKEITYIYNLKWLECYFKSLECEDQCAWCLDVTTAPNPINDVTSLDYRIDVFIHDDVPTLPDIQRAERIEFKAHYICPCKQLAHYKWGFLELPSTLKSQFQAFAVEQGYADCPNFDLEQFKQIHPLT